jgi:hypothetical protein
MHSTVPKSYEKQIGIKKPKLIFSLFKDITTPIRFPLAKTVTTGHLHTQTPLDLFIIICYYLTLELIKHPSHQPPQRRIDCSR